jgi:predicted regulator of Ras-like GTPase activity (Roadblock/LC7/MglB family)
VGKDQVINERQYEQATAVLVNFIRESQAKCALLVDREGQVITKEGFSKNVDTTALAALSAGAIASTKEIARLVGEPEFSVLLHQGEHGNIHFSLVGERGILVVLFDDRTTLGMVRLFAKQAVSELEQVLKTNLVEMA